MTTSFIVTQFGKELDKSLYSWDESTRTFSSNENNLVLDFNDIYGVTFKTKYNCTFKTGSNCVFKTGSYCTFETKPLCVFNTGYNCTFNTGYNCTFKAGSGCIFDTETDCIFETGFNCVVVRRDIFEVIVLNEDKNHIKLNTFEVKGYRQIKPTHKIIIDEEEIILSEESFNNLKSQLCD